MNISNILEKYFSKGPSFFLGKNKENQISFGFVQPDFLLPSSILFLWTYSW